MSRIACNFTNGQTILIDRLLKKGLLGSTRASIVEQIVIFYLHDSIEKGRLRRPKPSRRLKR